ncbi:MAG TPA: hypothetical protein VMV31_05660 [Terriglobales bacterium]|nr:hypothetical protein [Terriglobales bacterium]
MIVVMQPTAEEGEIQVVIEQLIGLGFDVHRETGAERTVLACLGVRRGFDARAIAALPGVAEAHRISAPYKLAARAFRPQGTVVEAAGLRVGGGGMAIIAASADAGAVAGARGWRLPQGLRSDSDWRALRANCERRGWAAVGEVVAESEIERVRPYVDIFQVGAANMQNPYLLRALGQERKPVLLERNPAASLDELLVAADVILAGGNPGVILSERGIRTVANGERDTLDLGGIARLKRLTHLPVVADLTATERELLAPLARAAAAVGADGLVLAYAAAIQ